MCTPIEDAEVLARYILSKSWLYLDNRPGNKLRSNAWLPHPRIELSVYRVDDWTPSEIDKKGEEVATERESNHRQSELGKGNDYPDGKRTFKYLGTGKIQAWDVRRSELDAVPKEPPCRHADIIGWPPLTQNRKQDVAAQMEYAMRLQRESHFVPPVE